MSGVLRARIATAGTALANAGGERAGSESPTVPPPRPRLLKAGDVALRARQLADDTAAAAATEAALLAARAEGFAAGAAAARADAEGLALAAGPRIADALEELAVQAGRLQAQEVAATCDAVLEAALDIAGWVLRASPGEASAALLPRLTEAARTLAPGHRTVIRVSEDDLPAVRDWAREGVEVVTDTRLHPGEARMDRGDGSAVLTFTLALRRAARTLGVPEPGPASPAIDPVQPR